MLSQYHRAGPFVDDHAGEAVTRETSGLSQGEWRELAALLPGLER